MYIKLPNLINTKTVYASSNEMFYFSSVAFDQSSYEKS
jgi:hypothetical protein